MSFRPEINFAATPPVDLTYARCSSVVKTVNLPNLNMQHTDHSAKHNWNARRI